MSAALAYVTHIAEHGLKEITVRLGHPPLDTPLDTHVMDLLPRLVYYGRRPVLLHNYYSPVFN